jgi:hypothetical protein
MAKTWLKNSEKTHTSQGLIRLKGIHAEHALRATYFLHFTWIIENNASKYFNCILGKIYVLEVCDTTASQFVNKFK